MQKNLDATYGLIFAEAGTMALALFVGKSQAQQIVQACAHEALLQRQRLRGIFQRNEAVTAHLSRAQIAGLFDACSYLGSEFTQRVASARAINSQAAVKD